MATEPRDSARVTSVAAAPEVSTAGSLSAFDRSHRVTSKTEAPTEPKLIFRAFEGDEDDPDALGNRELELSYKREHRLGIFFERSAMKPTPLYLEMQSIGYRDGINRTLYGALLRSQRMKGYTEAADSEVRARDVAAQLTIGCTVVTYMKLPDAANFGLPQGSKWSAPLYAQAVEYAKSLGLQFTTVDLNGKLGSSWWLYKQNVEEDFFSLDCIIPEDNYTPETAVLHTLWCINEESGFDNEFVDLSPLGTHVYGSMLRNPHAGINLDTYFAIGEARNFHSSLEEQLIPRTWLAVKTFVMFLNLGTIMLDSMQERKLLCI
ncbi:hypothetical protein RJ639_032255 [Escallonia herrerae]|uniref:Uncharacterized protein n=1 Tax=Escallonia herrerae TaxID=1293975 RepID=A0AA88WVD6_9ASTE|nr:hypothetical protein RJ639_032255 [Escallonia herrerae]